MDFVSLHQALELKMILKVFLVLPLPLYFVFLILALNHLHKKILIAGILVSFIYFAGATELIVWAYNHYSFFFDPYADGYRFGLVNLKYHWPYYIGLLVLYLIGILIYFFRNRAIENLTEYQITQSAMSVPSKKYQRITLD
jgi:hypothetical protein